MDDVLVVPDPDTLPLGSYNSLSLSLLPLFISALTPSVNT